MQIRQTQKLTQTLSLTPQMKQSLHILQLPLLELKDYLESQLEENLVLECEGLKEASLPLEENIEEHVHPFDWHDFSLRESRTEAQRKNDYRQTLIANPPSLQEYLLKQIRILALDEKDYAIAEFIIGNLDNNGYLNMSLPEVVSQLNKDIAEQEKITKNDADKILQLIHALEPAGVGARSLKECLHIQLKGSNNKNPLAYKIIESYLPDLAKNRIKYIAKKLKAKAEDVLKAKREISALEPKPGRAFSSLTAQTIGSSSIDIVLEKVNGSYQVFVNTRTIPKLKISRHYLNLLKSNTINPEAKKYIKAKIKAALGLAKAVEQRSETIRKIAEVIVTMQKEFLEHDDPQLLKPLTLKNIAKLVDRNESTVSRVVNNKYIDTPHGVYKLDFFFTNAIKTNTGQSISGQSIKHKVLNLIEEENIKKPLKDGQVASILKKEGIPIARRTVAKYRDELKILAWHLRKKKK
ncbi:MAG: RNA polymerase factor sigma-54 [Candidatus Omnitrophica bacterium]|nr:RNA polymerase factor sigma-54 [Candidatus Omnitrophota bacterium]